MVKCMEMEYLSGMMVKFIRVSFLMDDFMVMELCISLTDR